MTLLSVVIAFGLFVLVFVAGGLAYRWKLQQRTPLEVKKTDKRCVVCLCELPKGTMRDHRGRWTCAMHKGAA